MKAKYHYVEFAGSMAQNRSTGSSATSNFDFYIEQAEFFDNILKIPQNVIISWPGTSVPDATLCFAGPLGVLAGRFFDYRI